MSGSMPAAIATILERIALALWVGGTAVLGGIVAPLLFKRLPSRALAGETFGEMLARFEIVRYVLSTMLVLALFLRTESGQSAGALWLRAILVAALTSLSIYSGMVVAVKIQYFRSKIASFETVSPDDPWKVKFDQHHRRAVRLMMIGLLLAVGLLLLPEAPVVSLPR